LQDHKNGKFLGSRDGGQILLGPSVQGCIDPCNLSFLSGANKIKIILDLFSCECFILPEDENEEHEKTKEDCNIVHCPQHHCTDSFRSAIHRGKL